MRSLYLRIWLTVVLALALFALVSGWLWQRQVEIERVRVEARIEANASERLAAWAELVQRSLPGADAPVREQADALRDWAFRLRLPLALDDRQGQRIGASESYLRREAEVGGAPGTSVKLDDGRTLWIARRGPRRGAMGGAMGGATGAPFGASGPADGGLGGTPAPPGVGAAVGLPRDGAGGMGPGMPASLLSMPTFGLPPAVGPAVLLVLLFLAVAAGAYPVVRRLTHRLEALKQGVETFGGGALGHRVDASGRDEVAAVGATFNRAAERIETLVRSHQSLLANASHELRSPLARLKMAVALYGDAEGLHRDRLRREIDTNVAELDALVEEVLLASRLDAAQALDAEEPVNLLAMAAEEAARVGGHASGADVVVQGSERLLRRAMRNLLENARRYGGQEVEIDIALQGQDRVQFRVCDRGPGVPVVHRERIFEPFFRLPGHAEREGGVGLGLSLVRQIALRHGGQVECQARQGGGSCFVVTLGRKPAPQS